MERRIEQAELTLLNGIERNVPAPAGLLPAQERTLLEDAYLQFPDLFDELVGRLQNHAHAHGKLKLIPKLSLVGIKRSANQRKAELSELQHQIAERSNEDTAKQRTHSLETSEHVIDRLNSRYVHTINGREEIVLRTDDLVHLKPSAFKAMHNELVRSVDAEGLPTAAPAGELWLRNRNRNLARRGIYCDPQHRPGLGGKPGDEYRGFNTWVGRRLEPKEGDWSLLAEVLTKVFPEKAMHDWAIQWMARAVQLPWLTAETALVLTGPHGAGKSTIVEFFKAVFGTRHCGVYDDPQRVFGRFNEHLRDLVMLVAEEAFFHGDPRNFNKLKNRITGDTLSLEVKNGSVFQAPNRISNIIISNDDFVVQTAAGDRRYAVSKALLWKQNDSVYWTSVYQQMDSGGWAAFLHHLLALDLSSFDHRRPPETEALREQRRFTGEATIEQWMEDVLMRGYFLRSQYGYETQLHVWLDEVSTELLLASHRQWVSDHRYGRHEVINSRRMRAFITKLTGRHRTRLTEAIIGENRPLDGGVRSQHRPWGFRLPELWAMRQMLDEHTGNESEWSPKLGLSKAGPDDIPDADSEPDED